VTIANVKIQQYAVGLKTQLITSQGTIAERNGLIVRAESKEGIVGYGEIAPLPGFSREGLEDVRRVATALCRRLVGASIPRESTELRSAYPGRDEDRVSFPSVVFGIETMLADLAAKSAGIPLARWLNPDARVQVPINAIISGSIDEIKTPLTQKIPLGYRAYKLKVGVESVAIEKDKIAFLRNLLGPNVSIRLDANRAFEFDQAFRFFQSIAKYNIEYVEEPLTADLFSRLGDLRKELSIPIALDESLSDRRIGRPSWSLGERSQYFVESKLYDVAIIKPTLAGGISEVIELGGQLGQADVKMVISSTIETGIGLVSELHLASALGATVLPCGLDTLSLLSDSLICELLPVKDGCLAIPMGSGLGVTVCESKCGVQDMGNQ
jgi:o-succinylbenzoate synthase